MLINKLKTIKQDDIPSKNQTLEKYFSLSTNEKNVSNAFNSSDLAGQLISKQLKKQLKIDFTLDKFIDNTLSKFEDKISENEYIDILKDIYFTENTVPILSPLMYMSKPIKSLDNKTKKTLKIFEQFLHSNDEISSLETDLNFIEREIYHSFNEFIENRSINDTKNSYLSFIDDIFTKDFHYLLKNQHYFKLQIDRFLKFYFFIYSAQLALNIYSNPLEKPYVKELYFILNHEKASSERKELTNYGYKTLIDKVKYLFPYLSLLENLSEILEEKDLKYFHFKDLDNSPENISVIDEINSFYRIAKSMEDSLIKSDSIEEAFNNLLKSTMEQFRSNSKKAVIDRFINAYESQVSSLFFQSRGRGGKVLILDQDTILLLTNLAIGDKGQLRFQDLMKEFKKRSIYFDNRSEEALLELYERVGNVNRKSDSGDAVYVKSI